MRKYIVRLSLGVAAALMLAPGAAPAGSVYPQVKAAPATVFAPKRPLRVPHAVGLGKVLTTTDGGQIFGFDINQNGNDGVLADSKTTNKPGVYKVSVQTFDQNTGAITSTFANYTGIQNSYGVDGIFANDVGLITHYVTPKGSIYATRDYDVMNPVTANKFTNEWTPPIKDVDVLQSGRNQTTTTSVLFAIELKNQDRPDLIVTNIGANTVSKTIPLDPGLFGGGNGPQMDQYTAKNEAVIALSPDGGRVGGLAPINVLVDLATGKQTQFTGLNQGPYGSGYVNGLAVDPNTGIAATTTELNAQVEFYDLNKKTGIAVQLPCTGSADQSASGSGIANDPVNKLFLVTEMLYCNGSQGSALVIYDEKGNLLETITGFTFAIGEPAPAINPSKRMGWAFGPKFSQLQQFFY